MSITGNWDGRISRRTLLRTGGSAAAGIVLLGHAATARAIPPFRGDPFNLGVASGDPTPDGIVLWTRLEPAPLDRVRDHVPARELFSLADYRTRHAQYKTDLDLQDAHAAHPFLMTWDDHEFKDNYANLDLDPNEPLLDVSERRAAAYLAYWEHAPLSR